MLREADPNREAETLQRLEKRTPTMPGEVGILPCLEKRTKIEKLRPYAMPREADPNREAGTLHCMEKRTLTMQLTKFGKTDQNREAETIQCLEKRTQIEKLGPYSAWRSESTLARESLEKHPKSRS